MSLTANTYNLSAYYPTMVDYVEDSLTNGLYILYESKTQMLIDYYILEKKYKPDFKSPDLSFSSNTIQNTCHYDLNSVKEMVNKHSKWASTTAEAKPIIKTYGNNFYNYHESVSHDGYDLLGPVSDLWDLYIFYNKDGNVMVDQYHRENWYNGRNHGYVLLSTQLVNRIMDHGSELVQKGVPSFVLMNMIRK